MRSLWPIISSSFVAPMYLLIAALCGGTGMLVYNAARPDVYVASAKLQLLTLNSQEQDQHLAHQSDAQALDSAALAKRISDPQRAIRLPWWQEFRELALASVGISGTVNDITGEQEIAYAEKVLSHLQTDVHKGNKGFSISFSGSNPTHAALLANAIARSAILDAGIVLEEKRIEYIQFLERQVAQAHDQLVRARATLDSKPQSANAFAQQEELQRRIQAIENALAQIVDERVSLEAKLRSETATTKETGSPDYQLALQQRILDIELELSVESKELGRKHPKMIALHAERKRLAQLVSLQEATALSEAQRLLVALRTQEEALRQEIVTLSSQQQELEKQSQVYTDAKASLASLGEAKKWWSTQLAYAKTERGGFAAPLRLQIPASVPTSSENPLTLSAVLLSAIGCMVFAWLLKCYMLVCSKQFISIRHAQQYLGTEPVAVLPRVEGLYVTNAMEYQALEHNADDSVKNTDASKPQVLACLSDSHTEREAGSSGSLIHLLPKMIVADVQSALVLPSELSHSFRHLQNRLTIQLPPSAKSIAITSAIPFEGKSTIATQVAISMARAGYRSVVVDTSVIFTSTKHRIPGLAEYLSQERSLEEVLVCSPTPGLWNINAGNCTHETRSLLYSRSFKELLESLAHKFEYIFIDCPAISVAAESLYIADRADAFLLVSDLELGDKQATRLALQQLEQTTSINAGLVLNRYDIGHRGVPEQISVLAG